MSTDPRDPPALREPPRIEPPRIERRIDPLAAPSQVALRGPASSHPASPLTRPDPIQWAPPEPRTWEDAGMDVGLGEQLVLRHLAGGGGDSSRQIAADICLAPPMVKDLLDALKQAKLLQLRHATATGDFSYELTEAGRAKALDYRRLCAYVGPAPVPFPQYLTSLREQSLGARAPTPADIHRAFADLLVPSGLIERLGPAITSGRALFLHGDPGNGKTSIAERVTRCFGDTIWIPYTLVIDGHIVKLYDPATHDAVDPADHPLPRRHDRRWIRIRRPTVVAGGELTLDMLEIQISAATHIGEAPLQLKANGGTLVIDDFGRQRIEPRVLLNRWIFPLERRMDFLRLPDGRKIPVPFDALLIFSTNLEPRDLVDEAFLRRIPYKVLVTDPTEAEFTALTERLAEAMSVRIAPGSLAHLLDCHYRRPGRKLRFCHPRDLLLQVVHQCRYEQRPPVATAAEWDRGALNYFGVV